MIPSVPSSPLTETFLPLVHIFAKLRLEYFSRLAKRSESAQNSSCRRRLVTFWLEFRVSSKSENYFWFLNAINVYQGTFTVWHSTIFLQTETALMYDSALLFATALSELDRSQDVETTLLSCDSEQTWQHGNSLINYMKLVSLLIITWRGLSFLPNFNDNWVECRSRDFGRENDLNVLKYKVEDLKSYLMDLIEKCW